MAVIFVTHPDFADHDTGVGHPERPERLTAVAEGVRRSGLGSDLRPVAPEPATTADLERVHDPGYVGALERFCRTGGGHLDADTPCRPRSWDAALLAAGAGLTAVRRLEAGEGDAAFCAVRPPGHHARPAQAMGFCLLNNVAITAAALAERGERVVVVDYDAHHGNGTQDAFYDDPRVTYVSLHQSPLYPGTGALLETGQGAGLGHNVNVPVPPGTTGDVYRAAVDEVVAPLVAEVGATWMLVSAGFDGHRADPLTDLGLSAGDFADLTAELVALVPPGRRLVFLEGGYDLEALRDSTAAALAALAGERLHTEAPTGGGPGRDVVTAAQMVHRRAVQEGASQPGGPPTIAPRWGLQDGDPL
ncbi:MAG: histone deacetylase [Thermoanaerobacterales bacterium]|jgi:acetoin utilization deacetylase AcuC-like enzyme|nr:histone deacetylase [Thermoanaerobacterales bacterium]